MQHGSRLAYFSLTTLLGEQSLDSKGIYFADNSFAGSQTLGEEYCDILQYDVKTKKPPSPRVRRFAERGNAKLTT